MIRGSFRSAADQEILAELKAVSAFRYYVDKLRQAQVKATEELTYATPQDLPTKQGYLRCITELLNEINPGV
jgi:hypothetical protein